MDRCPWCGRSGRRLPLLCLFGGHVGILRIVLPLSQRVPHQLDVVPLFIQQEQHRLSGGEIVLLLPGLDQPTEFLCSSLQI